MVAPAFSPSEEKNYTIQKHSLAFWGNENLCKFRSQNGKSLLTNAGN